MTVSIVAEGGNMRGAYSLGALMALETRFGLKKVDVATGSSVGIGTLAYYVAGQLDSGSRIWTDKISAPEFLSVRNLFRWKPYVDMDFVIDCFKNYVPLNQKKIKNSKTLLVIPLTNSLTGRAEYFTNRTEGLDFFEVLRASMSIPVLCKGEIELNGKRYLDGAISDSLPLDFPEVRESKKIIILTKSKGYKPRNYRRLLRFFRQRMSPEVYHALKNEAESYGKRLSQIEVMVSGGNAVVIQTPIQISEIDNRRETLERVIKMGFNDAVSNYGLIEFISSLRRSERSDFYFSAV